ncbi:MAG: hypothetical protein IPK93_08900 [Solirubrobacterales bacterium]|nr:hypothetical protein [Solirubrobacterales bacterium]
MTWIETTSLTFTARHEDGDTSYAEEVLDRLEDLSLKLEDRFEVVPSQVTVIVHPSPIWLTMAHPFLPLVRWSAAPAGRRYLAGWPMATEVHVLGEAAMEKRAAGDASLEALKGTAERLYTEIVIAANNERIPPPWTPFRFTRYLRWAWLVEGAAQHFSRQVDLYRAAVIRRLREGSRPAFPPSRRDAILLGGTIFDLLEDYRGGGACELLVSRLRRDGPEANLEAAFDLPMRDIEDLWRQYLRDISQPDPAGRDVPTSLDLTL